MNDNHDHDEKINWGMHINQDKDIACRPCPKWVKSGDKDEWRKRGVVIWNETAVQILCLSPQKTLDVLDDLRETSSWKNEPFFMNWDSYHHAFSEESRKKLRSSKNRRNELGNGGCGTREMRLLPFQTQELLLFLELHEDEIQKLAQEHIKEARKMLGRVYALILSWKREPS